MHASANSTKSGSRMATFMKPFGLRAELTNDKKFRRCGFRSRAFTSSLSPSFDSASAGTSWGQCCNFEKYFWRVKWENKSSAISTQNADF
jgi:hypothetical protein